MKREHMLVGWYTDERGFRRRVELDPIELVEKDLPSPWADEPDAPPWANPRRGVQLSISSWAGRAYKRTGEFIMQRYDGEETGDPLDASGGQAQDEVANVTDFAPGWDAQKRDRLLEVWKRWHLNGANAECAHQRALGWNEKRIDESKPANTYGRHFEGQRQDSWNMLGWVRPEEHPEGLMTKPCPECGYPYGTAWLFEPLPEDVLAFVRELLQDDLARTEAR
jgi:hypothetical protein